MISEKVCTRNDPIDKIQRIKYTFGAVLLLSCFQLLIMNLFLLSLLLLLSPKIIKKKPQIRLGNSEKLTSSCNLWSKHRQQLV